MIVAPSREVPSLPEKSGQAGNDGKEGDFIDAAPGLRRVVTLKYAVALYVSSVLGTGILVIPGLAARLAGPVSLGIWVALSVASYPLAYTFASLSVRKPASGGIYSFAKEGLGQTAANAVGWLFGFGYIAGAPAATLIAGYYVGYTFSLPRYYVFAVAGAILLASFLVNYLGILFSGKVQLVVVSSIVGLLVAAVVVSAPFIRSENFQLPATQDVRSIGVAAALIVWSYVGYENVPNVAEEFKNPKRDFQRSVALSVILSSILYVLVAFAVVGTGAYLVGGGNAPFAAMISLLLGKYGEIVTTVVSVVIVFGTVNAYTTGIPRVVLAMSRDGGAPKPLSEIHPTTRIPHKATLFLTVGSIVSLIIYYLLNIDLQSTLLVSNGAILSIYLVGSIAGIRLLRDSGIRRLFPWISLLISLVLLPFVGLLLGPVIVVVVASLVYSIFVSKNTSKRNASR